MWVVQAGHIDGGKLGGENYCRGTSHVGAGAKYGVPLQGTTGHKFCMLQNGIHGITHGTARYLSIWRSAFNGDAGIALTDTVSTPFFLRYFDRGHTQEFAGVRQDSAPPIWFTNLILKHNQAMGVQSRGKQIIYSCLAGGGTEAEELKDLKRRYGDLILQAAGMGHYFLPFPKDLESLNIVMKADQVQFIDRTYPRGPVDLAKISDAAGKATGNPEAVQRIMQELDGMGLTMADQFKQYGVV